MKDWDDLRYFHAVAEAGSLSKASRNLGVNHSTTFRRINQLEEKLKTKLFDRIDNRYFLTSLGEEMYGRTGKIADIVDDIQRNISSKDRLMQGNITITCPESFAFNIMPRFIKTFVTKHPSINIDLMVSDSNYNLARREADIAIRATNSPPEYLIGKQLCSIPWSFYGVSTLFEPSHSKVEPAQLSHWPIIAAEANLLGTDAFQWLEKQAPKLNIVARSNSLMTMAAMAEQGIGVALLPADVQSDLARLGEPSKCFYTQLWLLTHPDYRAKVSVQTCMKSLYKYLEKEFNLMIS